MAARMAELGGKVEGGGERRQCRREAERKQRVAPCRAGKKKGSSKGGSGKKEKESFDKSTSSGSSSSAATAAAEGAASVVEPQDAIDDAEKRMMKAFEAANNDLFAIRAGRASPAMLDRVRVEYYGEALSVSQVAAVNVRDAKTLIVKPFDPNALKAIEKSISQSDLGLGQPSNDGESLIINIPDLTAERRKELKKQASSVSEDGKVAVRNVRRQALKSLDAFKDNGILSEDDRERFGREVQRLTDEHVSKLDDALSNKDADLDQT